MLRGMCPNMVGVIIACHGRLAIELLETSKMIVGLSDRVFAIDLSVGEDPTQVANKVETILDSLGPDTSCLILLDLFGGSPALSCARLALQNPRMELVSGVNLPMLLEVLLQREGKSLAKLSEIAEKKGKESIMNVREAIARAGSPSI